MVGKKRRECLFRMAIEGRLVDKMMKGRRRYQLMDRIKRSMESIETQRRSQKTKSCGRKIFPEDLLRGRNISDDDDVKALA